MGKRTEKTQPPILLPAASAGGSYFPPMQEPMHSGTEPEKKKSAVYPQKLFLSWVLSQLRLQDEGKIVKGGGSYRVVQN